jgi:universal stress protein A
MLLAEWIVNDTIPMSEAKERQMSTTAKKILCPIEFDESFLEAVATAKRLVKESNGTLYLMHVVGSVHDPLVISGALRPQYDAKVAQAELDRIGREQLGDVSYQTVVRVGDPGEEVLKAERELGIELLVLPTHKHNQFYRLLNDGVSHKIIDESECPVMALPEKVWAVGCPPKP